MSFVGIEPGVDLYYETGGKGPAMVFVHEFAGSCRSWDPQVDAFRRRFCTVAYNCRGYPPSSTPEDLHSYSQDRSITDLHHLLTALKLDRVTLVGLSMGGSIALNFALRHPRLVARLVIAATGAGSDDWEEFARQFEDLARRLEEQGTRGVGDDYLTGPTRLQLKRKRPDAWRKLHEEFCALSAYGLANTIRGTILPRPSIYELKDQLRGLRVPTLVLVGEEDAPTLKPSRFMADSMPGANLVMFDKTGHTINLEEPARFNDAVAGFVTG